VSKAVMSFGHKLHPFQHLPEIIITGYLEKQKPLQSKENVRDFTD